MRKKTTSIPINHLGDEFDAGISIEKIVVDDFPDLPESGHSERHDRHGFFLVESGAMVVEIDFQSYEIKAPTIMYMHPNQVHRNVTFKNVIVCSLAINDENLNPDYLKWLEELVPAKPILLDKETFSIIGEAMSLCMKFSERKQERLYHSLLKDSANSLVALIVSQYLGLSKSTDKFSRFDVIHKTFTGLLKNNYSTVKSPAEYAKRLNITAHYLNECVKHVTGHSVSYHIQQYIILEAKRLLYYSDKSVKEIAAELGFDDYPYFSRLFTKVTGVTALAFRNKNHE